MTLSFFSACPSETVDSTQMTSTVSSSKLTPFSTEYSPPAERRKATYFRGGRFGKERTLLKVFAKSQPSHVTHALIFSRLSMTGVIITYGVASVRCAPSTSRMSQFTREMPALFITALSGAQGTSGSEEKSVRSCFPGGVGDETGFG